MISAMRSSTLALPSLAAGHLERPSYWPDPAADTTIMESLFKPQDEYIRNMVRVRAKFPGERDTPAGREAALRWAGLRRRLGEAVGAAVQGAKPAAETPLSTLALAGCFEHLDLRHKRGRTEPVGGNRALHNGRGEGGLGEVDRGLRRQGQRLPIDDRVVVGRCQIDGPAE